MAAPQKTRNFIVGFCNLKLSTTGGYIGPFVYENQATLQSLPAQLDVIDPQLGTILEQRSGFKVRNLRFGNVPQTFCSNECPQCQEWMDVVVVGQDGGQHHSINGCVCPQFASVYIPEQFHEKLGLGDQLASQVCRLGNIELKHYKTKIHFDTQKQTLKNFNAVNFRRRILNFRILLISHKQYSLGNKVGLNRKCKMAKEIMLKNKCYCINHRKILLTTGLTR